jgi:hypothetical protein
MREKKLQEELRLQSKHYDKSKLEQMKEKDNEKL